MYQILVWKTYNDLAPGYRTVKKYYQAPNFDEAFMKILALGKEVFQEDKSVEPSKIEEELLCMFETGRANNLDMVIQKHFDEGMEMKITSKKRRYKIQLKKNPARRGDE